MSGPPDYGVKCDCFEWHQLDAEIDRLRAELADMPTLKTCEAMDKENDRLIAELSQLHAENARLRQAHSEMLTFMKEVQMALPSIFTDKARSILNRVDVMTAFVPPAADPEQQTPG